MQGRLRKEALYIEIETSCAHCDRDLHIRVDSDGDWRVTDEGAQVLVFEPEVNWQTFDQPNIIHHF